MKRWLEKFKKKKTAFTIGSGATAVKIPGASLVLFAGAMLLMRKRKRVSVMAHGEKGGGSRL